MSMDLTDTERKIADKMDPAATGAVALSQQAGGLGFSNMGEAMNFAKLMAISQFAVPKHLRGNIGACMAITIQAVEWRMSPFAVANKSYLVSDRLAYESQLVQAVVLQRAPIVGRFDVVFSGEGAKRRCTVSAKLESGQTVSYTSPEIGQIKIKNSPLWVNDSDQQLFYFAGRNLCRRHFPDVLLGIYTPDELYEETRRGPEHARDVTPKQTLPREPYYPDSKSTAPMPQAKSVSDALDEHLSERELERMADEIMRKHEEALDDPSGEKAADLLASHLDERNKLMGLI